MMFGLSGLRLYVGLGMIVAIVLLGATSAVLWSRIAAKQAAIESLTQQRDVAAADATRWQDAVAERQAIIDHQALTLRRLESDGQAARAVAEANSDKAAQLIAALEAQLSKLKEAAHARPQDVRALGPIVRNALPSLQH
jgi:hypothetical protein